MYRKLMKELDICNSDIQLRCIALKVLEYSIKGKIRIDQAESICDKIEERAEWIIKHINRSHIANNYIPALAFSYN